MTSGGDAVGSATRTPAQCCVSGAWPHFPRHLEPKPHCAGEAQWHTCHGCEQELYLTTSSRIIIRAGGTKIPPVKCMLQLSWQLHFTPCSVLVGKALLCATLGVSSFALEVLVEVPGECCEWLCDMAVCHLVCRPTAAVYQ